MKTELELIHFDKKVPLTVSLMQFNKIYNHMHLNPQLILVLDGKILIKEDKICYKAKENDIFIINSRIKHSIETSNNSTATILSVILNLKDYGIEENKIDSIQFNLNSTIKDDEHVHTIKYILASLIKFNTQDNSNNEYNNRAIAFSLFAQLFNNFKVEISNENNQSLNKIDAITKITSYIEDHYQEKITLDILAKEFDYAIPYISKLFKDKLNTTFINYYDSLRINFSLNDLLETNLTINQIADNNGFENSRSYVRAFNKIYGENPTIFRNKHEKNSITLKELKSLKKEALEKIYSLYDQFGSQQKVDKSPKINEHFIEGDLNTILYQRDNPANKIIQIYDVKRLFFDDTKRQLKIIQKEVGFTHIFIPNLFESDIVDLKNNTYPFMNSTIIMIDKLINYLKDLNLKPFISIQYSKREYEFEDFKNRLTNFMQIIKEKYEPSLMDGWIIQFDIKDNIEIFTEKEKYASFSMNFEILKTINKHFPKVKIASLAFEKDNIINNPKIFNEYFALCKKENIKLDLIPISFFDKNRYNFNIIKDKNELSNFINFLKNNMFSPLNLIWIKDFNFTNAYSNLLNDTIFASSFLIKNTIDNYQYINSISRAYISDLYNPMYDKNNFYFGGEGSLTYNDLKKASFNALIFLSSLGKKIIHQSNDCLITQNDNELIILLNDYNHYSNLFANQEFFELKNNERYIPFSQGNINTFTIKLNNSSFNNCIIKTYTISKENGSSYDKANDIGNLELFSSKELDLLNKISELKFQINKLILNKKTIELKEQLNPFESKLIIIKELKSK